MQIREYSLPAGWFPRDPEDVSDTISRYLSGKADEKGAPDHLRGKRSGKSRAAISPHAGWYYSGRIAAIGAASLEVDAETVVVIGGHLSANSPALFAMEDAVRTPFGPMPIDAGLRSALQNELKGIFSKGCAQDRYRDNTVEVLLPMVRFFFPKASLLWLRLPACARSFETGKALSLAAAKLNRKINVLASTDLTHYGLNYGFMPKGTGAPALRWVSDVNDANFIRAVEEGNSDEVLLLSERDMSSCSAGAVLGAMGFANVEKTGNARLLEYATSAGEGREVPDSFVGYAAMAFGN